jgi:MFS family permease
MTETSGATTPTEVSPHDRWRLLESIVWLAALGVLAFALVVAVAQAARWLRPAMRAAFSHLAVGAEIAFVVILALAAVAAGLWLERHGRWRLALATGVVTLVGLRLLVVAVLPSPIESDWALYLNLGQRMLEGLGFWSARPPGYPMVLMAAFGLGGVTPLVGEVVNIAVSAVAGLLLVVLVEARFGRVAALLGLFAYALIPSSVLWTVILGVETLYASALVLLVVLAIRAVRGPRGHVPLAVLLGVGFGLAQYVKPSSQILGPAILLLPALVGLPWRRVAGIVSAGVIGFAVVVSPIIAWNVDVNQRVSLSPYLYDGWILYVGLSLNHDGQFNQEDDGNVWIATGLSTDGSTPPDVNARIDNPFDPELLAYQRLYNDTAGRLGLERLRTNGLATIPLEVRKASVLWARADQPVAWIFRHSISAADVATRNMLRELAQGGWVVVLAGAMMALVVLLRQSGLRRRAGPRPPEVTAIAILIGATAVLHLFAQVNPRFHEYLVPLTCALSGIGGIEVWRGLASRRRPRTVPEGSAAA